MSCCHFSVFEEDFSYYFQKAFDSPPTSAQLKRAKRDWRSGNTGWEAVQIAKELIAIEEQKAKEKPLVNIGGNNFAHEGSELALHYRAAPRGGA